VVLHYRTKKILASSLVIAFAASLVIFLPIIPVKTELWCFPQLCLAEPFFEQGYSSASLYLFDYGGVYVTAFPNQGPLYLSYCFVSGFQGYTSCGATVDIVQIS